ncbi:MAG: MaoC family dehydratase [Sphingobium sp.]
MPVNYNELATGKWFEDLEPGNVYKHSTTRTVTEADNLLFSALSYNSAWLHMDDEYCKTTFYGKRLVNSLFTLTLACGVTVNDMSLGTTLGNLGFSDIKFTKPVFIGDTLYVETEVIDRRESKSRPDCGIVDFENRVHNQRDELVCSFRRTGLMQKRPTA